jgi:long-chain acyl-CoA synthetase
MELSATIPALLRQHAASYGSETIFRHKDRGIWNATTWSELEDQVRGVGQGLIQAGLVPGGVVAILAHSRPEFAVIDLAVLSCGGVSLAIDPEEESERVREILRTAGASFAVVEGEEQLDKILSVRTECPSLRRVIMVDMKGLRDFSDPACVSLTALVESGAGRSDWRAVADAVDSRQSAAILVSPDRPERTVTHADLMHAVDDAGQKLGVRHGDERLAVLPMSDPTERILGLYLALKFRIVSNYLENPETATENLREVKPTIFGANVEAWERLHARITYLASAATGPQRLLYFWAIGASPRGGLMGALANFLVLPAVRSELGFSRLRVAYVGDGMVSDEIADWARALGVSVEYIDSK